MNKIKFAHYRLFDTKENKVLSHGGITLAYTAAVERGITLIKVAGAKCHKRDNYVKKTGRKIAAGKLNAHFSYYEKGHKQNWMYVENNSLNELNFAAKELYGSRLSNRYKLIHSGVYFSSLKESV